MGKKIFWFGILIWIILFAIAAALLAYGKLYSLTGEVVMLVFAALLALIFAGYLKPTSFAVALAAGIVWLIIGLLLDYLITRQLAKDSSVNFFTQWSYWLSYLLIVLAPLVRVKPTGPDSLN